MLRRSKWCSFVLLTLVALSGCKTSPLGTTGELSSIAGSEPRILPVDQAMSLVNTEDFTKAVAGVAPEATRGGGVVRLDVRVPKSFSGSGAGMVLSAEAFDRNLSFYSVPSSREDSLFFSALLAVPYDARPKKYSIPVRILRLDQESLLVDASLTVVSDDYPAETLSVDPRHVSPGKSALRRIQRENSEIGRIYRRSSPERLWSGPFDHPVSSIPTSEFGVRRVFNGSTRSFHQGRDYRAAIGTPIHASGAGRVVLAKDLYMTGNTVILDHGLGLFTIYAHLSALNVEVGKQLPRGHLLGLSGATGRASGPHLHFGVNLNRIKVDPVQLMKVAR
jgi:murein DD-endopeptidase MepM/ murein hydrolase activator NlpD